MRGGPSPPAARRVVAGPVTRPRWRSRGHAEDSGRSTGGNPARIRTEAPEFPAGPGALPAPRFIASDAATGLLVTESRRPPLDLLDGPESPAAARGLAPYARAPVELAAATVGRADERAQRRRAPGLAGPGGRQGRGARAALR